MQNDTGANGEPVFRPKRKPGRPPLPPEVRDSNKRKASINRRGRIVNIMLPSVEMADEARQMLGADWAKTLLCALHYWHGTNGEKK